MLDGFRRLWVGCFFKFHWLDRQVGVSCSKTSLACLIFCVMSSFVPLPKTMSCSSNCWLSLTFILICLSSVYMQAHFLIFIIKVVTASLLLCISCRQSQCRLVLSWYFFITPLHHWDNKPRGIVLVLSLNDTCSLHRSALYQVDYFLRDSKIF